MNRSPVKGILPETNLKELRWKEVQSWLRRIPSSRAWAAIGRTLASMRQKHAAVEECPVTVALKAASALSV